jgi:UDP-glucose 4-epimerase
MAAIAGGPPEPRHAEARTGDLRRSVLDSGRAAIHLGWKSFTPLVEGLETTIDWFRRDGAGTAP